MHANPSSPSCELTLGRIFSMIPSYTMCLASSSLKEDRYCWPSFWGMPFSVKWSFCTRLLWQLLNSNMTKCHFQLKIGTSSGTCFFGYLLALLLSDGGFFWRYLIFWMHVIHWHINLFLGASALISAVGSAYAIPRTTYLVSYSGLLLRCSSFGNLILGCDYSIYWFYFIW